jgi:hypothetical protein
LWFGMWSRFWFCSWYCCRRGRKCWEFHCVWLMLHKRLEIWQNRISHGFDVFQSQRHWNQQNYRLNSNSPAFQNSENPNIRKTSQPPLKRSFSWEQLFCQSRGQRQFESALRSDGTE